MPVTPLDLRTIEAIFRASEGRTSLYEGRDANPEGEAHAIARHYVITNEGLWQRLDRETRNNAIGYFSAFITRADMVSAAADLLNGPAGTFAREQLFDTPASAARPAGSHTGMRAVIQGTAAIPFRVRYAMGGGASTMPARGMRMLLDRIDTRPAGLHIHTFFPTLATENSATVKRRDGRPFAHWP